MEHKDTKDTPYFKLLLLIGVLLKTAGFIFIGSGLTAVIFNQIGIDVSLRDLETPNLQIHLLYFTGISAAISFILLPTLYIYFLKQDLKNIFKTSTPYLGKFLILAILVVFIIMPVIAVLAEWNREINLPDRFAEIEQWMAQYEQEAEKLIQILIYYENPLDFLLILSVIAILPAIGEEILFRGVIQNELKQIFGNPHVAIWTTGFIFSFIHLQFFGFFPRMFLGVLFGYLYYWSGNLLVPMAMHFINNALTFLVMNLHKQKTINFDIEKPGSVSFMGFLISAILTVMVLYLFWQTYRERKKVLE